MVTNLSAALVALVFAGTRGWYQEYARSKCTRSSTTADHAFPMRS